MENDQLPGQPGQPIPPESPTPHSPTGGEKVIQPLSQDLQPVPLVNPTPTLQPSVAPPPHPAYNNPLPLINNPPAQQTTVPASPVIPPTDPYAGLTGSQMQQQKQPLPVGVYVIAGFNFLGFVASFFDSSQSSGIYTIAMLLDLLLAIGLVLRLEVARKLIVVLSGLILVLSGIGLIQLAGFQQRLQQAKTKYDNAVSRIDPTSLTPAQQDQLQSLRDAVSAQEKKAGKAIAFTYIKLGVTAAETIAVVVYLSRPKVKEVFHQLEA